MVFSRSHYWMTLALAALLLPLGALTRLTFEPPLYLLQLFTKVAFSAVALAAILHVVDTPLAVTIASFKVRPARLLIPAAMACVFVALLGWWPGLFVAAVAFVILEFFYRYPADRFSTVSSFLLPALYLLVGVALVCYYNNIAASVRFPGTYDPLFMRLDAWLGIDVPAASKQAVAVFSPRILEWAEEIYFRMFDILGATLILIALEGGLRRAMQFVGAILLAYYITLGLFLVLPSQGPYYLCLDHAQSFPNTLASYPIHMSLLAQAKEMWQHTSTMAVQGGYFISFPCMHVVKPTVALWYLRGHKRIGLFLCAYLLVLPIAIVLLEMHYLVDVPVGFAIAALVIFVSDPSARVAARPTRPAPACSTEAARLSGDALA
jgi:PAP2 superfamily protein